MVPRLQSNRALQEGHRLKPLRSRVIPGAPMGATLSCLYGYRQGSEARPPKERKVDRPFRRPGSRHHRLRDGTNDSGGSSRPAWRDEWRGNARYRPGPALVMCSCRLLMCSCRLRNWTPSQFAEQNIDRAAVSFFAPYKGSIAHQALQIEGLTKPSATVAVGKKNHHFLDRGGSHASIPHSDTVIRRRVKDIGYLGTISGAKLLHDIANVHLNRTFAHVEFVSDNLVCLASTQRFDHRHLA
jgi:hypothetical protein